MTKTVKKSAKTTKVLNEKVAVKTAAKAVQSTKEAVKKTELKKETVKKPAAKAVEVKTEPKKTAVKEVKKSSAGDALPLETKQTVSKPVKAEKARKKTVKKPEVKKTESVKESVKKSEPVKKAVKKETVKKEPVKKAETKPVVKKDNKKKLEAYQAKSLEECISLMQKMNVQYKYEDYYRLILDEADLKKLEKNIIEGNHIKDANYDFDTVGYDADLVMVTLNKVADTMDIKASDFKEWKKEIKAAMKFQYADDGEVNAAEYLNEFSLSEKLLMAGQRKDIHSVEALSELVGADIGAFFKHFFDFAYALLPTWQYNDVKFYEDFAYAILSQYADLFESEQLRVQIDVADLYIKHGDYQHGDEIYSYILRDNQIKDFIYYRYASVYKDIDYNKAKSIAYSSLQVVDDRYTYYPNIMEIIQD